MRNDNDEYNNYSLDKKVGFVEDGHKYILIEKPALDFTSVTTVIANYKEKFLTEESAKRVVLKEDSKYFGRNWEEVALEWDTYGKDCAEDGTELHAYGEKLFNGIMDAKAPDNVKAKHALQAVNDIFSKGYKLATTELLVYSEEIGIAGQSDVILKKKKYGSTEFDYMIYDWKFKNKKLPMKSFWSKKAGYKMMKGPFKFLMDCDWIHHSIQLSLYQTLTGEPEKISEKVLIIVYDDHYELVPAYPMRVFWDQNNNLQCVHEIWNGRWYDSRMNQLYKRKPQDIVGI